MDPKDYRGYLKEQLFRAIDQNEGLSARIEQLTSYILRCGYRVPEPQEGINAEIQELPSRFNDTRGKRYYSEASMFNDATHRLTENPDVDRSLQRYAVESYQNEPSTVSQTNTSTLQPKPKQQKTSDGSMANLETNKGLNEQTSNASQAGMQHTSRPDISRTNGNYQNSSLQIVSETPAKLYPAKNAEVVDHVDTHEHMDVDTNENPEVKQDSEQRAESVDPEELEEDEEEDADYEDPEDPEAPEEVEDAEDAEQAEEPSKPAEPVEHSNIGDTTPPRELTQSIRAREPPSGAQYSISVESYLLHPANETDKAASPDISTRQEVSFNPDVSSRPDTPISKVFRSYLHPEQDITRESSKPPVPFNLDMAESSVREEFNDSKQVSRNKSNLSIDVPQPTASNAARDSQIVNQSGNIDTHATNNEVYEARPDAGEISKPMRSTNENSMEPNGAQPNRPQAPSSPLYSSLPERRDSQGELHSQPQSESQSQFHSQPEPQPQAHLQSQPDAIPNIPQNSAAQTSQQSLPNISGIHEYPRLSSPNSASIITPTPNAGIPQVGFPNLSSAPRLEPPSSQLVNADGPTGSTEPMGSKEPKEPKEPKELPSQPEQGAKPPFKHRTLPVAASSPVKRTTSTHTPLGGSKSKPASPLSKLVSPNRSRTAYMPMKPKSANTSAASLPTKPTEQAWESKRAEIEAQRDLSPEEFRAKITAQITQSQLEREMESKRKQEEKERQAKKFQISPVHMGVPISPKGLGSNLPQSSNANSSMHKPLNLSAISQQPNQSELGNQSSQPVAQSSLPDHSINKNIPRRPSNQSKESVNNSQDSASISQIELNASINRSRPALQNQPPVKPAKPMLKPKATNSANSSRSQVSLDNAKPNPDAGKGASKTGKRSKYSFLPDGTPTGSITHHQRPQGSPQPDSQPQSQPRASSENPVPPVTLPPSMSGSHADLGNSAGNQGGQPSPNMSATQATPKSVDEQIAQLIDSYPKARKNQPEQRPAPMTQSTPVAPRYERTAEADTSVYQSANSTAGSSVGFVSAIEQPSEDQSASSVQKSAEPIKPSQPALKSADSTAKPQPRRRVDVQATLSEVAKREAELNAARNSTNSGAAPTKPLRRRVKKKVYEIDSQTSLPNLSMSDSDEPKDS